jgi:hypothetical protein
MWDMKLGRLTFGERTEILLGKGVTPAYWLCRMGWGLFAVWTMSMVGTEAHIPLHMWLIATALYYYYPT